ncbi:LCP family protein [Viridibacillus arvi]|uniref:LytR family transcriptional regulator n=1 Tax=Viridibacillus arvi TaxID=263475 RepID=A0A0M0LKZ6_9BACL|nr:LCP family protein [Viridibacillus arvi]KOO51671.1 LytR family transcriptional regulator [Viridibacillus arvi]
MRMKRNTQKREKSKKKLLKIVKIVSIYLFLAIISYGGFVFIKMKNAYDSSTVNLERTGDKSDLREDEVTFNENPISILLLGIEDYSSKKKDGRADTQMVITLDPSTNVINMVTVPRDTRVNIENAGEFSGIHKMNSAYTYGDITGYGAVKLQIETVEKFLNIPIDNFIAINFEGFRDIVDALGGVSIDIKTGFWEENIYDGSKIDFNEGKSHLTGEESLAFVRMRKRAENAIYSREERQRQFLKATIDQAISAGTIFKIGQLTDILGKNVETNLSLKEIYALQKKYSKSSDLSIKTIAIKGTDRRVDGSFYYIPEEKSLKKVSKKLRNILQLNNEKNFITNADFVE